MSHEGWPIPPGILWRGGAAAAGAAIVILAPQPNTAHAEADGQGAPAEPAAEAEVEMYSGIAVVNPRGVDSDVAGESAEQDDAAIVDEQEVADPVVDTSDIVSGDAVFITTFATPDELSYQPVISEQAFPQTTPISPASTLQGAATDQATTQRPVTVQTNAPAIVSVGSDGAVNVQIIGEASQASTQPLPTEPNTPTPDIPASVPVPETSPTPQTTPQPETNPASTTTESVGTAYVDYLAAHPSPAIPDSILEVKEQTDAIKNSSEKIAARTEAYKGYTDWLMSVVEPTAEGYEAFKQSGVNITATDVFSDERPVNEGKTITPTCTVTHLMAGNPGSVEQFAQQMKWNVQFAAFHDGVIYQTTPYANTLAYHAAGVNSRCIGIENAGFDVLDLTPQQVESNIYFELWLSEKFGFNLTRDVEAIEASPVDGSGDFMPDKHALDATTVYGHADVDDVYNDHPTGKIDPPTFFMNAFYEKLDAFRTSLLTGRTQRLTVGTGTAQFMQSYVGGTAETLQSVGAGVSAPTLQEARTSYLQALMSTPVLTQEQLALRNDATAAGMSAPGSYIPSSYPTPTTTPSKAPSPSPATDPASGEQAPAPDIQDVPDGIVALLSQSTLNDTAITPEQAYANSANARMNGGTLDADAAFGPVIPDKDVYAILRGDDRTVVEAGVMTAISMRETALHEDAVGDLGDKPEAGFNDDVMASFGPFQVRYVGTEDPLRDPQRNLRTITAILDASQIYEIEGSDPWEVIMPGALTEDSIFEAIRLPERDLGDKRASFDIRMRQIDKQIFAMVQTEEPLVQQALAEEGT